MAILIPSKKIYNPHFSLIKDNKIGEVTGDIKYVYPNNQVDVLVHTEKVTELPPSGYDIPTVVYNEDEDTNTLDYTKVKAATTVKTEIVSTGVGFSLKRQSDERNLISKVYVKPDEQLYTVIFRKTLYRVTTTFNGATEEFDFDNAQLSRIDETDEYGYEYSFDKIDSEYVTQSKTDIRKFNCEIAGNKIKAKTDVAFFELGYGGGRLQSTAESETPINVNNEFDISPNQDFINISNIIIPSAITVDMLYSRITDTDWNLAKDYSAEGYRIVFEPIRAEISIKGDTLSIAIEDAPQKLLSQSRGKPLATSANEISQLGNTLYGKKAHDVLFQNILDQYSNGKEIIRIVCPIGEYFDENGEVSISTKNANKMAFENGDIVIPMRYNVDGRDVAMSIDKSGNPKRYAVVSERIYYDGAVWQELYLQEYTDIVDNATTV